MKWSDVEVWADNTIGGDREPLAAESFARALLALKPVVEALDDMADMLEKPQVDRLGEVEKMVDHLEAKWRTYRKGPWRIEP